MIDSQTAGSIQPGGSLLDPISAANTAAATTPNGAWVDASNIGGYIIVTQQVGVVTAGSITGQLMSADDVNGTGAVPVSGGAFAAVSASSNVQRLVLPQTVLPKRYIGYAGTVTGTSVLVCVVLSASKKN
jgi:hypothetical protein